MFSATWPQGVRRMAMDFLRDPTEIRIGNADALIANTDIVQEVVICEGMMQKEGALQMLLKQNQCQAIVFTNTKRMAEQLANMLGRSFRADAIHGDRNQQQRLNLGSFQRSTSSGACGHRCCCARVGRES